MRNPPPIFLWLVIGFGFLRNQTPARLTLEDVVAVSAVKTDGLAPLEAYLTPATTIALLGSSGVGKIDDRQPSRWSSSAENRSDSQE